MCQDAVVRKDMLTTLPAGYMLGLWRWRLVGNLKMDAFFLQHSVTEMIVENI